VVGDLGAVQHVAAEVARAEAVIHLASPRSQQRESVILHDVLGTAGLLDAWRRGNFVYASSQTVYGVPRQPLSESAPVDATCWYDLGKICNEFQARMAAGRGRRGAAVSLRLAVLFGAGDRRHDRQFLPEVVGQCRRGATFVFDSEEGLETYGTSFIGEGDLGRAVADALAVPVSGAYNVAGDYCTWRALVEAVDRRAGTRSRFLVRPGARPGPGEYRLPQSRSDLDTSAFRRHTGFVPHETLELLVERFVRRSILAEEGKMPCR
jgi:nucleoside-diphosphate-sugar epimerase